eukprot:gene4877-6083_t
MESYLPKAKNFISFINNSPSPYHAVAEISELLKKKGFTQLSEKSKWEIKPNSKYFFTRNQSCLSAFCVGGKYKAGNGFTIAGAHTDSPNLKVRPISNVESVGIQQVGCETYGGGLWFTWFDRDLSVAGRVLVKTGNEVYESKLVHVKKPILRIPSLAIHLDRTVNENLKINTQNHLVPIVATKLNAPVEPSNATATEKKHHPILLELLSKELGCKPSDIQNFDLSVCDTQPAAIGGALDEFIFAPRCDNLCMSFCSIEALLSVSDEALAQQDSVMNVILYDNEEIGSSSPQGACAPLITDTIARVNSSFIPNESGDNNLTYFSDLSLRNSFLVSADMAHAVHPNYVANHEPLHRPALNKGPVIKHNANHRYATTGPTSLIVNEIGKRFDIPIQEFVVKNDSPCGSTIGPIIAGTYGIRTVDIGNPQFSMHSIRETCGVADITHAINLLRNYFEQFSNLDKKIKVDLE